MEKFFSVAAELAGGETRVLPVRGRTAGEAFQQAKTDPGVRRVGKVTEITPGAYEALQRGEIPPAAGRAPQPAGSHTSPEQPDATLSRAQLNAPLTGPRIILDARPVGGEQPFRHLQAPPERPQPQTQAAPKPKPRPDAAPASSQVPGTAPVPAVAASQPLTAALKADRRPTEPAAGATGNPADAARAYRIIKSRRQGGDPYLLQRGQWHDRAGKRSFTVDWEKGFPARPDAERHQEWLTHRELELADLRRQAG